MKRFAQYARSTSVKKLGGSHVRYADAIIHYGVVYNIHDGTYTKRCNVLITIYIHVSQMVMQCLNIRIT
jgi:hypothetical protein